MNANRLSVVSKRVVALRYSRGQKLRPFSTRIAKLISVVSTLTPNGLVNIITCDWAHSGENND